MRILFTSNPGFGHVYPMVPLARALVGRGHEVRWAVAAEARSRLEAAGPDTFPAGIAERRAEFDRCLAGTMSLPPEERPDGMFPAHSGGVCAPPMLRDLLPIVDAWQPALIVNDAAWADAIADALGRLLHESAFADAAGRISDEIAAMPAPDDVAVALEGVC